MVPDFNGLCKQSSAIADSRAAEPKHSAASDQIKSFFVQHFSEKVMHSEAKVLHTSSTSITSCAKSMESEAKPIGFVSKSLQNTTCQSDDALTDYDTPFYQLWTSLPSWSPILKKADGWITIVNPSGKKVPLVLGTVESHYRRGIILGKRFGKLTNYLMIDVDTGSPFHPRNGGIDPILAAMESLGLCRYLLIRSSSSGGLHIYFPLAEPVNAWGIACAAHAALTAAGVTIAGGICELFPNKKAFNAEHNGHRLPLQQGSFLLDDDFRCTGNAKAAFLTQWQLCAAGQDAARLAEVLLEKHRPIPQPISADALPPVTWTDKGQSNDVMRQLVNYGDEVMGHRTIQSLGDWIVKVAPRLPGFHQFASAESRNDVTRRNWAYRWAKCHFKAGRLYAAKSSFDHNATVAAEALERLLVALDKVVVVGKLVIRKLWRSLSDISKELFGVGFGWKLFQKHRDLILESIRPSRNLGLSNGNEENKNVLSSETATPGNKRAEKKPKNHLTELATARCVTAIDNQDLRASTPPINRVQPRGGSDGGELAMGARVICQQPGQDIEGVETRVTGKTTQPDGTLLYRLEACFEGQALLVPRKHLTLVAAEAAKQTGLIRATTAQLIKVLGKACPFVGPGLWKIRPGDVSKRDWRALQELMASERVTSGASIV